MREVNVSFLFTVFPSQLHCPRNTWLVGISSLVKKEDIQPRHGGQHNVVFVAPVHCAAERLPHEGREIKPSAALNKNEPRRKIQMLRSAQMSLFTQITAETKNSSQYKLPTKYKTPCPPPLERLKGSLLTQGVTSEVFRWQAPWFKQFPLDINVYTGDPKSRHLERAKMDKNAELWPRMAFIIFRDIINPCLPFIFGGPRIFRPFYCSKLAFIRFDDIINRCQLPHLCSDTNELIGQSVFTSAHLVLTASQLSNYLVYFFELLVLDCFNMIFTLLWSPPFAWDLECMHMLEKQATE